MLYLSHRPGGETGAQKPGVTVDVDRNEKIWAPSNTGIRTHAFVQYVEGTTQFKRALCRKTILRNADSRFIGAKETSLICQSCMMIAVKMWERAEASMEPAQERHDVGYVAPVEDEQAVTEDIRSEAIAEEAARQGFTEGARVVLPNGQGATVLGDEFGVCKIVGHPNYGKVYAGVAVDPTKSTPRASHGRRYLEELQLERAAFTRGDLDTLRAEALELDEIETLKAELIGKVFRPCVENMHRKLTDRITVTEILTDIGSGLGVAYDIETDDWQGRRVTMHSALSEDLFRQLYVPVSETRWEYSGMVSVLDDYNHETLRRISGYVTAPEWDDARSEVLRLPSLESPRAFLTDLRITQS